MNKFSSKNEIFLYFCTLHRLSISIESPCKTRQIKILNFIINFSIGIWIVFYFYKIRISSISSQLWNVEKTSQWIHNQIISELSKLIAISYHNGICCESQVSNKKPKLWNTKFSNAIIGFIIKLGFRTSAFFQLMLPVAIE